MKSDTQKIKDMARLIRANFENYSSADYIIRELETVIRANEKQHRRGRHGDHYAPISLAVDLFLIRTIASAVRLLTVKGKPRKLKKNMPCEALCVRMDYLIAIKLVAGHLGSLFQTSRRWCVVRPADLVQVDALCNYTEIVCK